MLCVPDHPTVILWISSSPLISQGVIIVYDITSQKSFDNIANWLHDIEKVSVRDCMEVRKGVVKN